jgi:hypothetical protein
MSYSLKKQTAENKATKLLLVILSFGVTLAIIFFILSPPQLADNFCPLDKSKIKNRKMALLIDISSSLSNQNKKIVNEVVADWISKSEPYQMLSIYSLNTSNINDFEDIDTICSPPNSKILSFALGQKQAKERLDQFKTRIKNNIEASSKNNSQLTDSKIIESIRQITNGPNWTMGHSRLILISDLIEKSQYADFYSKPVPNFDNWKESKIHESLINDIKLFRGDKVQICQLLTDKPGYEAREKAQKFWIDLLNYKKISEVYFTCNGLVDK